MMRSHRGRTSIKAVSCLMVLLFLFTSLGEFIPFALAAGEDAISSGITAAEVSSDNSSNPLGTVPTQEYEGNEPNTLTEEMIEAVVDGESGAIGDEIDTDINETDQASPELMNIQNTEPPITLSQWYLDNEGLINSYNVAGWVLGVFFKSAETITSIELFYSLDGATWESPAAPIIIEDYGLESFQEGEWARGIMVDFSGLGDGQIFLKAIATDQSGDTLSVEQTVTKDIVAENIQNLTVTPNEGNTALVLNWTNPEDIGHVKVYKYVSYGDGYSEWQQIGETSDISYTDSNVYPNQDYTYKVVAYDKNGNVAENPPTVTGRLQGQPIYFIQWYLTNDGVVSA
jgi:hypothetical protein